MGGREMKDEKESWVGGWLYLEALIDGQYYIGAALSTSKCT